jgi:hypothetical protein
MGSFEAATPRDSNPTHTNNQLELDNDRLIAVKSKYKHVRIIAVSHTPHVCITKLIVFISLQAVPQNRMFRTRGSTLTNSTFSHSSRSSKRTWKTVEFLTVTEHLSQQSRTKDRGSISGRGHYAKPILQIIGASSFTYINTDV